MIKFLYSFEYSNPGSIPGGPFVIPGPMDAALKHAIARNAELVFKNEKHEMCIASQSMISGESNNLQHLTRTLFEMKRTFWDCEVPVDFDNFHVEDGTIWASPRPGNGLLQLFPDTSSAKRIENLVPGDVIVVCAENDVIKVACLPLDHVYNKVFRAINHANPIPSLRHCAYEFKIHIDHNNNEELKDPFAVKDIVKRASEALAMEIWVFNTPYVDIEEIESKYGGHSFCITIVSRTDKWVSDRCFPEDELKKHLAFEAGIPDVIPSVEVFNVVVV